MSQSLRTNLKYVRSISISSSAIQLRTDYGWYVLGHQLEMEQLSYLARTIPLLAENTKLHISPYLMDIINLNGKDETNKT